MSDIKLYSCLSGDDDELIPWPSWDDDDTDENSVDSTSVDLSGQAVGNGLQSEDLQIEDPSQDQDSQPLQLSSPVSKPDTEDPREKVQETPTTSSVAVEVSPVDVSLFPPSPGSASNPGLYDGDRFGEERLDSEEDDDDDLFGGKKENLDSEDDYFGCQDEDSYSSDDGDDRLTREIRAASRGILLRHKEVWCNHALTRLMLSDYPHCESCEELVLR